MPNGRSGGFVIPIADLKELVTAVPPETVVGQMCVDGPPFRAATAAEASRFVEECPQDRVAAEEQDHALYVLHLSNDPIQWLILDSKSPIFLEIRRRHDEWKSEHPGWNGWVGF